MVGNVDIHGSSTVFPISNAVAEDIAAVSPEFSYFVGFEGTGAGFSDFFCVDSGDIADASRPIRADDPSNDEDEEATICANNGVEFVELKVGYDGIAVITDIANPIECLTFADLYALMGPESDAVANWNDAEALAQQLGSTTDLPDAALSITAPGDESGTYDSFVELAIGDLVEAQFGPDEAAIDENLRLRTPGGVYIASSNDNAIIQGVGGTAQLARLRGPGLRRGERRPGQDPGRRWRRRLRRGEPRNRRRWHLSHLATAVHLPQPHASRWQSGNRELRGLLPVRRGHRQRCRDGLR